MNPLPDYWELLALFEAEPKKRLDPEIPWQYNRLEFESQRGADNIYCALELGYERVEFVWSHREKATPVIGPALGFWHDN